MKYLTITILTLILSFNSNNTQAQQQNCENIAEISFDKLTPIFENNDFAQVDNLLTTIVSVCNDSEITQRIRILRLIIDKKNADAAIDFYINNSLDKKFTNRMDNADNEKYKSIYEANKVAYNFVPLRHPIDQLTKRKAIALLASNSFNLNPKEELITLLFADRVEDFYDNLNKAYKPTANQTQIEPAPQQQDLPKLPQEVVYSKLDKSRVGVAFSAGAYMPINATNPIFKHNAIFGISVISPLENSFIFEGMLKVRINSNDRNFDYALDGEIYSVNSPSTYQIGGSVGYKVFDNDRYIIYPKLAIAYESTSTGLSETTYYDDYYDEFGSNTSTKYNNLNTVNIAPGVTFMRAISKKTYIGINANYHYSPYQLDKNLQTEIYKHYSSIELFIRF